MMRIALAIAFLTLAACGADDPPKPRDAGGISVSGTAKIGVVGSL